MVSKAYTLTEAELIAFMARSRAPIVLDLDAIDRLIATLTPDPQPHADHCIQCAPYCGGECTCDKSDPSFVVPSVDKEISEALK